MYPLENLVEHENNLQNVKFVHQNNQIDVLHVLTVFHDCVFDITCSCNIYTCSYIVQCTSKRSQK